MRNTLFCLALIFTSFFHGSRAETLTPLSVHLSVTHVAADKWQVDYVFSEAITSLRLGPKVGAYRKLAWHVLTPGVSLLESEGLESLSSNGKPLTVLSLEVQLYQPYEEGNYTAFDRFSDGGTDFYMGFLVGEAVQGERVRPLHWNIQLTGLPGETVITPDMSDPEQLAYSYFGPREPVAAGMATLMLDPRTPDWMATLLLETTATISTYYEQAFKRKLGFRPLVLVSIADLDTPGLSIKGGMVGKQISYRLGGKALLAGSPKVRLWCMELIAHELAHIWQRDVARGGIGEQEAWVHEGGAEAIAITALRLSGMFSQADADAYSARLIQECVALKGSVESHRGIYACGYKRFFDYDKDIFVLWKTMIETSETSGAVYSESMINTLLPRVANVPMNVK